MNDRTPELTLEQREAIDVLLERERRYRAANLDIEDLRSERNKAVQRAVELGVRPARVADYLGLTQTRVGQILRGTTR